MAQGSDSIFDRSPAVAFIKRHPVFLLTLLLSAALAWLIAGSAFSAPGGGPVQISQAQSVPEPLNGIALADFVTADAAITEDAGAYPFVAALARFADRQVATAEVKVEPAVPQNKTADAKVVTPAAASPDFASNSSLADTVIVLDPGHGAADSPGVKASSGIEEADIVLDISKRLRLLLTNAGAKVKLTRETAFTALTNKARAEMANDMSADVFLRIHAESYLDASVSGVEALWAKNTRKTSAAPSNEGLTPLAEQSRNLAKLLGAEVSAGTGFNNLGATEVTGYEGLIAAKVPATQVSIGALSNSANETFLRSDANRQKTAESLYKGIVKYIHGR